MILQMCTNNTGTQFKNYPNELQSIFDLYASMSKEEFEWINEPEFKILKFSALRFILNYTNNDGAFEHIKTSLDNCMKDRAHAKFIMSTSNLHDCYENER